MNATVKFWDKKKGTLLGPKILTILNRHYVKKPDNYFMLFSTAGDDHPLYIYMLFTDRAIHVGP